MDQHGHLVSPVKMWWVEIDAGRDKKLMIYFRHFNCVHAKEGENEQRCQCLSMFYVASFPSICMAWFPNFALIAIAWALSWRCNNIPQGKSSRVLEQLKQRYLS
jgi:hypothetical protein